MAPERPCSPVDTSSCVSVPSTPRPGWAAPGPRGPPCPRPSLACASLRLQEAPGLLLLSAQRPEEAVEWRLRFVAQPSSSRSWRCLPAPPLSWSYPPGPGPSLALMPGLVAGWFGQRPGELRVSEACERGCGSEVSCPLGLHPSWSHGHLGPSDRVSEEKARLRPQAERHLPKRGAREDNSVYERTCTNLGKWD